MSGTRTNLKNGTVVIDYGFRVPPDPIADQFDRFADAVDSARRELGLLGFVKRGRIVAVYASPDHQPLGKSFFIDEGTMWDAHKTGGVEGLKRVLQVTSLVSDDALGKPDFVVANPWRVSGVTRGTR